MLRNACVGLLSLLVGISGFAAAQEPAASIPVARRLIAAQDWDGAAAVLEELLAENDANAQAWFFLAYTFAGRGDWEEAAGLYELAGEYPKVAATAYFNAACLYASHGRADEAFANVELALAAGFKPLLKFWNDSDLESLRADERFAALVPRPIPSSECFLEKPRILHTFYGEAPGDVFGWIGRNLGDADLDGRDDILLSAPQNTEGGRAAGKIYVYSGATGELLFERVGKAGEQLGIGIETAGDVDADGRMDAIAGAANLNVGPGTAYVYSGADGSTLHTLTVGKHLDAFGRKVSGGVDFDDDGHADVLVGAPGALADGTGPGVAYVYSGKNGEVLARIDGERAGDAFGAGNAVWSDGERKLLAVGAANAGPGQRGRTYVYRWVDGEPEPFFRIESDSTGVALGGMFVAFPGDFDGDGISEVYASDWQNAAKGPSTGRIYMHSGATGDQLFTLTGERPGDGFGTCTADVGDVDGDGLADLLVGAWQAPDGAPSGGKCYLYTGEKLELSEIYTSNQPGETLGFDTTGMGDLDGDGGIDFLVTGGYSAVAGAKSGRAFVIAGPRRDAE